MIIPVYVDQGLLYKCRDLVYDIIDEQITAPTSLSLCLSVSLYLSLSVSVCLFLPLSDVCKCRLSLLLRSVSCGNSHV